MSDAFKKISPRKKIINFLLISLLIASISFSIPACAQTVNLDLSQNEFGKNEEFSIALNAENISGLFGVAFTLNFDPSLVTYVTAAKGDFLTKPKCQTSLLTGENPPGSLVVGFSLLGADCGEVSGSGNLMTLTFNTNEKSGINTFSFSNYYLCSLKGCEKTGDWNETKIEIEQSPIGNIIINDGDQITSNREVNLDTEAADISGIKNIKLSNTLDFQNALLKEYSNHQEWTLEETDGVKNVYTWFEDSNGNWSLPYSDSIILDAKGPEITALTLENMDSSARISWTTDELSSSQIVYNQANNYEKILVEIPDLAKDHSIFLGNLLSGSSYLFRVTAKDSLGNYTYKDFSFFTLAAEQAGETPYDPPQNDSSSDNQDAFENGDSTENQNTSEGSQNSENNEIDNANGGKEENSSDDATNEEEAADIGDNEISDNQDNPIDQSNNPSGNNSENLDNNNQSEQQGTNTGSNDTSENSNIENNQKSSDENSTIDNAAEKNPENSINQNNGSQNTNTEPEMIENNNNLDNAANEINKNNTKDQNNRNSFTLFNNYIPSFNGVIKTNNYYSDFILNSRGGIRTLNLPYPDGVLLQLEGKSGIWLIDGSLRRLIPSAKIFEARFAWDNVIKIKNPKLLEVYPVGAPVIYPDGALIAADDKDIYIIENEEKRLIISREIFKKLGYDFHNINYVSKNDLENYRTGKIIDSSSAHASGALVRVKDNIFRIYGNQLAKIPTPEIFSANNFKWENIVDATPADKKLLPGADVFFPDGALLRDSDSFYVFSNGRNFKISASCKKFKLEKAVKIPWDKFLELEIGDEIECNNE